MGLLNFKNGSDAPAIIQTFFLPSKSYAECYPPQVEVYANIGDRYIDKFNELKKYRKDLETVSLDLCKKMFKLEILDLEGTKKKNICELAAQVLFGFFSQGHHEGNYQAIDQTINELFQSNFTADNLKNKKFISQLVLSSHVVSYLPKEKINSELIKEIIQSFSSIIDVQKKNGLLHVLKEMDPEKRKQIIFNKDLRALAFKMLLAIPSDKIIGKEFQQLFSSQLSEEKLQHILEDLNSIPAEYIPSIVEKLFSFKRSQMVLKPLMAVSSFSNFSSSPLNQETKSSHESILCNVLSVMLVLVKNLSIYEGDIENVLNIDVVKSLYALFIGSDDTLLETLNSLPTGHLLPLILNSRPCLKDARKAIQRVDMLKMCSALISDAKNPEHWRRAAQLSKDVLSGLGNPTQRTTILKCIEKIERSERLDFIEKIQGCLIDFSMFKSLNLYITLLSLPTQMPQENILLVKKYLESINEYAFLTILNLAQDDRQGFYQRLNITKTGQLIYQEKVKKQKKIKPKKVQFAIKELDVRALE